MSRDARHGITFNPQRIVGFISGGCGGVDWRSARADWPSRTCNASLRGASEKRRPRPKQRRRTASERCRRAFPALHDSGCGGGPFGAPSEHPDGLVHDRRRGRAAVAARSRPGCTNEITRVGRRPATAARASPTRPSRRELATDLFAHKPPRDADAINSY